MVSYLRRGEQQVLSLGPEETKERDRAPGMLVRTRDGASRALALYHGPDLKVNARWGNLEYDPGADPDLCFGKTGCFTGICEIIVLVYLSRRYVE